MSGGDPALFALTPARVTDADRAAARRMLARLTLRGGATPADLRTALDALGLTETRRPA